jgi:hypothetical protein
MGALCTACAVAGPCSKSRVVKMRVGKIVRKMACVLRNEPGRDEFGVEPDYSAEDIRQGA